MRRRVVVTGLGVVSPLGSTVSSAWRAVVAGQCGLGPITRFDPVAYSTRIGGQVKAFDIEQYTPSKVLRRADPQTHFGYAAAAQAIADAGLEISEALSSRVGVAMGAFMPGLVHVEGHGAQFFDGTIEPRISPTQFVGSSINSPAAIVSAQWGLCGPSLTPASGCSAGAQAIALAARLIQWGDADVMIAGATSVSILPFWLALLGSVGWLSRRNAEPARASRPWDRDCDGAVLADGAAVLLLEERSLAKRRGARIYAELAGVGQASDGYDPRKPSPFGQGCDDAMHRALEEARAERSEISWIAAGSLSNPAMDRAEAVAIKRCFDGNRVPVSSTKGATGYLGPASGALTALFGVLAIRDQVIPPTINLEAPADDCRDLEHVRQEAREAEISAVLANSPGLGGVNTSLVFRRA